MSIRVRCVLLAAAMMAGAGCLPSGLNGGDDGGAGGNGSDGGSAPSADTVKARFVSDVQPIIKPACGVCHSVAGGAGPSFMLEQPDMLQNMLIYPGLIGDTPESSRLYTKGQHEGPGLTPGQAPVIHDWIVLYNQNKMAAGGGTPVAPKPAVKPFAPTMGGANTVDLSQVDAKLAGMTLTFTASQVGSSLELSKLTVVAAPMMGVHIAHPLFSTWDGNTAIPDPVDSFSNVDETVAAGKTAPLGPGLLILPNYTAGQNLNVVFAVIEPKAPSAGGGTTPMCKALQNFVTNVKPFFAQSGCSTNCHRGTAPTAGLAWDATPDAQLCLNALSESNVTTPANSKLLQEPNPNVTVAGHPNKFTNFAAFQTAFNNWIAAEK